MNTKIKDIRKMSKKTVHEVAEYLEISESFYYKIEQGTRTPTLKLAKKISNLFKVGLEELF